MRPYFDRMTLYRFTLCVIKTEKQVVIFGASVALLPFFPSLLPRQTNATYLLTYLLTPWSRVLLEKLTSKLCS